MQRTKFDVVICDWTMAGMDGPALVRAVRADPLLERTPIVMAVACRDAEQIAAAMAAGAAGHVVKPFGRDNLRAGIEQACGPLG